MRPTLRKGSSLASASARGMARILQLPVAKRLAELRGVLVDDHRSEVELPPLELLDLLVDGLGRELEPQRGQRREQAPDQVLGAAAHRADSHAQTPELLRRGDAIRGPAEHHQRLWTGEATDQLEPVSFRELHALLHQGEVRGAPLPGGDQPLDVLHRAGSRDVGDAALSTRGAHRHPLDDRMVVALRGAREEGHLEVPQARLGIAEGEERSEHAQRGEEDERLDPGGEPGRIRSQAEHPSLAVGRRHRARRYPAFPVVGRPLT